MSRVLKNNRAVVEFSATAWAKMTSLIFYFNDEVAWHGIAKRSETEDNAYTISDILVYPQEVTGATVNTDQVAYQDWLYAQPDEVFNNLRMQGHSHVNMAVSPSTTDTANYENTIRQLNDEDFYIFMIWNKRLEKTILIYDYAKNILFETSDVTVRIEGASIGAFIADASSLVKHTTFKSAVPATVGAACVSTVVSSKKKEKLKAKTETKPADYKSASYWKDDDDGNEWYDDSYYLR